MTTPVPPPPKPPGSGSGSGPGPGQEFERDVELNDEGIVGARWWHKALASQDSTVERRHVLVGLIAAGGVLGAIGMAGYGISKIFSGPNETVDTRRSLEMQRQFGWDFGARGKPLVFNGVSEKPFVRADLDQLPDVMLPAYNAKYYVNTLPMSLKAQPAAALPAPAAGTTAPALPPFKTLSEVILPIVTPEMEKAYRAGEALARLCSGRRSLAILADLPGPECVAFAAGACSVFEPVLLFDNWPHPVGVVPTHQTLAALAYYQPRFAEQKNLRSSARPLFLLDRRRMSAYSEESDRFDNRYYARAPRLSALAQDEIQALLYVVASPAALPEPDDINAVLAPAYPEPQTVAVRALALTDFGTTAVTSGPSPLYFGGSAETDATFWIAYPYDSSFTPTLDQSTAFKASDASRYSFISRSTAAATTPESLGNVAVMVGGSGLVMAAALGRRGSQNRFSGGWSG